MTEYRLKADGSVKTKLESLRQELKHDALVSEVI